MLPLAIGIHVDGLESTTSFILIVTNHDMGPIFYLCTAARPIRRFEIVFVSTWCET